MDKDDAFDPLPPSKKFAAGVDADVPLLRKPWQSLNVKQDFQTFPDLPSSFSAHSWSGQSGEFKFNLPELNKEQEPSLKNVRGQKGAEWSRILEEEKDKELADQFQEVAVQKTLIVERGSESYSVGGLSRQSKRKRDVVDPITVESREEVDSDVSDISDTGLDDDDQLFIAGNSKNMTLTTQVQDEEDKESTAVCRAKQQAVVGNKQTQKRTSFSKLAKILENVKDKSLGIFISARLREKNKALIDRCVDILGRDYCVHMFRKALKIEYRGGLKIKNNSRRRTPGGVFLYMIRMDKKNSRDILDRIFIEDVSTVPAAVANLSAATAASGQFRSRNNVATEISLLDSLKQKMTESSRHRFGASINQIHSLGSRNDMMGKSNSFGRKKTYISEQKRTKVIDDINASSYRIVSPSSTMQQIDKRANSVISYDDVMF